MIFKKTKIKDCYQIDLKKIQDERGFFSRLFCLKEFKDNKINIKKFVQSNNSLSKKRGTFRGFHFQKKPYQEDKLVRCVKGEVFNICLDLRKSSNTYLKWVGIKLNEKNRFMMLVPKGCANAHLTLKNNSEIIYFSYEYYAPKYESGVKYKDKLIKLRLPLKVKEISDKDLNWQDLKINS